MPELFRLYLDQMIQKHVAEVPFLQKTAPAEVVDHLVILSANKEKWILTANT